MDQRREFATMASVLEDYELHFVPAAEWPFQIHIASKVIAKE